MQLSLRRQLSTDSRAAKVLVPTYGPATGTRTLPNLLFKQGKGVYLYDDSGNKYLDMSAGIAVSILGHADEQISQAVNKQLSLLAHTSNLFHSEPPVLLAERLIKMSPGFAQVFFCNSGTEANEGALKFARIAANAANAAYKKRIIAFKSSFHGRTLGALSVTYKPAIREPFSPLLNQNVDFCEFNNISQVEEKMDKDVMAVIVEPVQGEGGVNPAEVQFLKQLRELCNKNGSVLIFDEIQIGLGRSGSLWGHDSYGVQPDLMTIAKPLAGGMPIGAVMMHEQFKNRVPENVYAGAHGTTFGGNPVVCAAALSVLDRLEDPLFLQKTREAGEALIKGLSNLEKKHSSKIQKVRRPLGDKALYAGVLLAAPVASQVTKACLTDSKVVFITAGDKGDTIRICPPLIMTVAEVNHGVKALDDALSSITFPSTSSEHVTSTPTYQTPKRQIQEFKSAQQHRDSLKLPLPGGFLVATDNLSFVPKELGGSKEFPMRLTLIALDNKKTTKSYAAVFTKNAFPGAPITIGKSFMESNAPIGGVLINNKVSNVQPRGGGMKESLNLCTSAAKLLNLPDNGVVIPASTGVIGWSLPEKEMLQCLPKVVNKLQSNNTALIPAEAIMTTDRYPKARSKEVKLSTGKLGRITGIAKGAGMIEPNMATMLVYLLTDVDLAKSRLQPMLEKAVNGPGSFNRITVDSDQSTSDMCLLLSSSQLACTNIEDQEEFAKQLNEICSELAEDIVRNGEGTRHVVRVQITGAPSEELAHGCAKAVANSPLVKCAIFGNDPNVGRILAALGSYLGRQPSYYVARKIAKKTRVKVGGIVVYENGQFALDSDKEKQLSQMMKQSELNYSNGDFPVHNRVVQIDVDLNAGEHGTVVLGSDLSQDYVDVNADYRS